MGQSWRPSWEAKLEATVTWRLDYLYRAGRKAGGSLVLGHLSSKVWRLDYLYRAGSKAGGQAGGKAGSSVTLEADAQYVIL